MCASTNQARSINFEIHVGRAGGRVKNVWGRLSSLPLADVRLGDVGLGRLESLPHVGRCGVQTEARVLPQLDTGNQGNETHGTADCTF